MKLVGSVRNGPTLPDEGCGDTPAGGVTVAGAACGSAGARSRSGEASPRGHADRPGAPKIAFSWRESEVLSLLAEGFSNKEIAERLFLAEGTVKNRVSDILLKIDARDRTQAALRARELGLL